MFVWSSKDVKRLKANNGRVKAASNRYLSCCKENKIHFKNIWHGGGPKFLCFILHKYSPYLVASRCQRILSLSIKTLMLYDESFIEIEKMSCITNLI